MPQPSKEIIKERANFMQSIVDCVHKPSKFSDIFLGHKLFEYNQKYVDCQDRFIVYRSGRQVGKTMSTAVKTVHFAFFAPLLSETVKNECIIVIAAPTQNQATNTLMKLFAMRMPRCITPKMQAEIALSVFIHCLMPVMYSMM